jgi:hypothetical protein
VLPDTLDQDVILAGTDTAGVYVTDDAGVIWNRDTLDLTSREILKLGRFPGSGAVYCCATGASILAHGAIGISEESPVRHPAPVAVRPTLAGDRLSISLAHPATIGASIDLYRADGTRAWRLAELQTGVRTTEVVLPNTLARGTYLLVVRSGETRQTTKLVLTE